MTVLCRCNTIPVFDEILGEGDVLCLPTYFEGEALPLSIIEAMSYGTAIVATRWRAIPSLVDGTNGMLVPPRDSAALAEVLAMLAADRELVRKLGDGARLLYEQNHTEDRYRETLESVLLDVAADRRSRVEARPRASVSSARP